MASQPAFEIPANVLGAVLDVTQPVAAQKWYVVVDAVVAALAAMRALQPGSPLEAVAYLEHLRVLGLRPATGQRGGELPASPCEISELPALVNPPGVFEAIVAVMRAHPLVADVQRAALEVLVLLLSAKPGDTGGRLRLK